MPEFSNRFWKMKGVGRGWVGGGGGGVLVQWPVGFLALQTYAKD